MAPDIIAEIDRLKTELDDLRPLPPDAVGRLGQKLRIEWNYHSNAIEGNALTLGETRSLILYGLTARGKPMRDHLDIEGHDDAVKAVEEAVAKDHALDQAFIRGLHRILLKESYDMPAETPDGQSAMRPISIGQYKEMPNNVRTQTGETHYFAPPEQVPAMMSDLIDWCRAREAEGEHPIVVAATFHYRFVQIHPFDDGNGRMARLLMNLILMRDGYTIALVQRDGRDRYIAKIEQAQTTGDLAGFIQYIAKCCRYSLELHLRAARGESIDAPDDIDREIAVFKHSLVAAPGEGGLVQVQVLAANVLFPLYAYFQEKVESLATLFCRNNSGGTLVAVGSDGEPKRASMKFAREVDDLPQSAVSLRMEAYSILGDFRASTLGVTLAIERTESGKWRFRLSGLDLESEQKIEILHVGDELDELKKGVNALVRGLMTVLGQWSSQDVARV